MKKVSCIFALAVLLLAAPFAYAQQSSDAQVDRLLEVMRAKQTLEAILPQVQASQQQMVAQLTAGQQLDAQEQEQIQRIMATTNARVAEALSWEKMEPVYRDIYTATFNTEDIDAMIEFYASPAGQNLLDKMPQLMQNTMTAVQQLITPMLQQLEQDIAAELGDQ
ncbi:MAG: DUF2059 domain-containing protein [Luteimonas sp.]